MNILIKNTLRKVTLVTVLFITFLSYRVNSSNYISNISMINRVETEDNEVKKTFLADKQGEWVCYKYEIENPESAFDDNYAQEFVNHAYFKIRNDTLSASGIYNTPVYGYKYPVEFKSNSEESIFISYFKPDVDSVFFIVPFHPYEYYWENSDGMPSYQEAPMNKMDFYWNNSFIINDRGYFFFFKKGKKETGVIIRGVPGDDRNYFRVEKLYRNISPDNLPELLKIDFPYGFGQVMDHELFSSNDWSRNQTLRFEKSQSLGKFVMEITIEGDDMRLLYFSDDDASDSGEDYQG